jgi:hypothetical protein
VKKGTKSRCCTKRSRKQLPSALQAYRQAASEYGYLQAGESFKPLPKKGTKEYALIKARSLQLLSKK